MGGVQVHIQLWCIFHGILRIAMVIFDAVSSVDKHSNTNRQILQTIILGEPVYLYRKL